MDTKKHLKRTSTLARINKDNQVPNKIRKTKENLSILTKKQLIEKITILSEEIDSLKDKVKACDPAVKESNVVKQNSSSTQTVLEDEDLPFPCQVCIYNAAGEMDLRVHMDYAHDIDEEIHASEVTCKLCKIKYPSKSGLRLHLKTKHESSVPPCKHFQTGTCRFNETSCWFVHKRVDVSAYKCRYCEYKCAYKSEVMNHQKENHEEKMQICKSHIQNKCKFRSKCWFKHVDMTKTNEAYTENKYIDENNE